MQQAKRPYFIPREFAFAHDYSFRLHDSILKMLTRGQAAGLFHVTVPIDPKSDREFGRDSDPAAIEDWMRAKHPDLWPEVQRRVSFPALVGDALHFLYEALRCSEKGKLTVTFALIRKPLRETLFQLEYMLADPAGFAEVLDRSDARQRSQNFLTQGARGRALVEKVIPNLGNGHAFDPAFLYELRFDKGVPFGLEGIWHQAMHLVTDHPHLATEPQNINFIFSDDDSRITQWQ